MPGTYNGGDFSLGKDASLGDIFAIQQRQDEQAARNIAAYVGVSHGELVAAASGSSPTSGSGPGNGSAAARSRPVITGGPAAGVVGVVGASGRMGVGHGAVMVPPGAWSPGGSLFFGGHALPMNQKTQVLTQVTVGGMDIQHDRGWSDGGAAEQAWGDTDFLTPSWFYQWAKFGADMKKTVEVNGPVAADIYAKDAAKMGGELMTKGAGAAAAVNSALDNVPFAIDWLGNGSVVTGNRKLVKGY